jgi:[ribosomal protein S5]-alanine N-acetyltransferase
MRIPASPWWSDDKVSLFLLTPDDVSGAYVAWLEDQRINRFLESRFARHDLASTREFVAQMCDSPKQLMLGIRSLELGGLHIGNIKIGPIDSTHGLGEIGILIGEPSAWGKGIGRAAIARVVEIARRDLGLRKLTAGCYASNVGSEKAFRAAGFEVEGVRRRHFLLDGQPEDLTLLGYWID